MDPSVPVVPVHLAPRWRKVIRDLWINKTRTALVVISIAVGVLGVGMISGSKAILTQDLTASYLASNPSHGALFTEPFDQGLLQAIRNLDGVAAAEGRRNVSGRVRLGEDAWQPIQMVALDDIRTVQIRKIQVEEGRWPPDGDEIFLERASLASLGKQVGDAILVQTPDGRQRTLTIAGRVHDVAAAPPFFSGQVQGYIAFQGLEALGESPGFNELLFRVTGPATSREEIRPVAEAVRDKVEKSGRRVYWLTIPEPGKHWAERQVNALIFLLTALGVLALALSGFLVVNTTAALITQQVRQIGVMKTIGGRRGQIFAMYMGMVMAYGLLSLTLAVPLGAAGAWGIASFSAGLLNTDIGSFRVYPGVLALEVVVGILMPLLAALFPVLSGTRITVREALNSYGIGRDGFGQSWFDRLLERVRGLPRPLLLSVRNTFRRKGRLLLTLTTLILAAAIFIAVFSVRASLQRTLDRAFQNWQFDILVNFNRSYRTEQLENQALAVPGVALAESWGSAGVRRLRPDGSESDNIVLLAPPTDTQLMAPVLLEGRWLLPEDENGLVINSDLLAAEPDLAVGDQVVLKIQGRETRWLIVGVVQEILAGPFAYTNYPYFAQVTREAGRASSIRVVTERPDPLFQAQVAKALERRFEQEGLRVNDILTTTELRRQIQGQFDIIVAFLLIMAVLLALVGGLGLMGAMSINVLERTREVGVMRAVGATNGAILRIVISEGVFIGLLSWTAGAFLAYPLSRLLSDEVGRQFIDTPLRYTFSMTGLGLWLLLVTLLSALASFLPAWNASRLSVREVLAYE